MASEGDKKMITLRSSDNEEFEVEEAVAMESQTIRHMIEDDCADNGIPLPNVNSKILSKVIEYCNKHVHAAAKPAEGADAAAAAANANANANANAGGGEDLKNWDAEFVKVDQATLFDLILAANYLNIKGLLDLTCQTVADMIKGKTPEEINNPTLPDKDVSSDSVVEDDDRISKFEKEVEETFQRALGGGVNQDNLILEINGLRLAYSLQRAGCAGAVFCSVMKSALVAAQCTDDALLVTTVESLDKWKDLLRNYTKTIDEEMEILLKFGVMCQEITKDFSQLFSEILPYLYDMEVVSGDAILRWEEEKEHADKSYKFFIKESKAFIQWLKEPEVDE